eukprot:TRINITY_DN18579_c0_g1_i1.p1 TRINITY_DN18579_c0_g1~~TRINITY_DN18579_c0_g1_i1.p1  ORF type:complete len:1034 (+),score=189.88 TRINITY_DN18579_c0_g1_i1:103-3204(+)
MAAAKARRGRALTRREVNVIFDRFVKAQRVVKLSDTCGLLNLLDDVGAPQFPPHEVKVQLAVLCAERGIEGSMPQHTCLDSDLLTALLSRLLGGTPPAARDDVGTPPTPKPREPLQTLFTSLGSSSLDLLDEMTDRCDMARVPSPRHNDGLLRYSAFRRLFTVPDAAFPSPETLFSDAALDPNATDLSGTMSLQHAVECLPDSARDGTAVRAVLATATLLCGPHVTYEEFVSALYLPLRALHREPRLAAVFEARLKLVQWMTQKANTKCVAQVTRKDKVVVGPVNARAVQRLARDLVRLAKPEQAEEAASSQGAAPRGTRRKRGGKAARRNNGAAAQLPAAGDAAEPVAFLIPQEGVGRAGSVVALKRKAVLQALNVLVKEENGSARDASLDADLAAYTGTPLAIAAGSPPAPPEPVPPPKLTQSRRSAPKVATGASWSPAASEHDAGSPRRFSGEGARARLQGEVPRFVIDASPQEDSLKMHTVPSRGTTPASVFGVEGTFLCADGAEGAQRDDSFNIGQVTGLSQTLLQRRASYALRRDSAARRSVAALARRGTHTTVRSRFSSVACSSLGSPRSRATPSPRSSVGAAVEDRDDPVDDAVGQEARVFGNSLARLLQEGRVSGHATLLSMEKALAEAAGAPLTDEAPAEESKEGNKAGGGKAVADSLHSSLSGTPLSQHFPSSAGTPPHSPPPAPPPASPPAAVQEDSDGDGTFKKAAPRASSSSPERAGGARVLDRRTGRLKRRVKDLGDREMLEAYEELKRRRMSAAPVARPRERAGPGRGTPKLATLNTFTDRGVSTATVDTSALETPLTEPTQSSIPLDETDCSAGRVRNAPKPKPPALTRSLSTAARAEKRREQRPRPEAVKDEARKKPRAPPARPLLEALLECGVPGPYRRTAKAPAQKPTAAAPPRKHSHGAAAAAAVDVQPAALDGLVPNPLHGMRVATSESSSDGEGAATVSTATGSVQHSPTQPDGAASRPRRKASAAAAPTPSPIRTSPRSRSRSQSPEAIAGAAAERTPPALHDVVEFVL